VSFDYDRPERREFALLITADRLPQLSVTVWVTMEYEKEGEGLTQTGNAEEIDRLIEETEDANRNTRSFLEYLRSSEDNARELVDSMKQRLEKELDILQRRNETGSSS
jgi:hypothetical protein